MRESQGLEGSFLSGFVVPLRNFCTFSFRCDEFLDFELLLWLPLRNFLNFELQFLETLVRSFRFAIFTLSASVLTSDCHFILCLELLEHLLLDFHHWSSASVSASQALTDILCPQAIFCRTIRYKVQTTLGVYRFHNTIIIMKPLTYFWHTFQISRNISTYPEKRKNRK